MIKTMLKIMTKIERQNRKLENYVKNTTIKIDWQKGPPEFMLKIMIKIMIKTSLW